MNVLILHQHFKTPQQGGAIRSYYLAKALVDKGISVTVITAQNSKTYEQINIEGIHVHYLPIPYDNRFTFLARSTSFLKYVIGVLRRNSIYKNADICYAISVPLTVGIAARWITWTKKIPYIFEVGDLWPEAPIQMGIIKNFFFKQMLYALEKQIYSSAKAVVALSVPIKKAIELKTRNKKVHVISNMADIDFYMPEQKNNALEKKFGVDGKFVISYIGALGAANGLNYFLDCARASQRALLPVQFLLCGDGAMLENLKRSAGRLQLTNLTFLPFRNREGVREIMNVTDAAFVCYKTLPVLETGSPNKYFDALASGKLIIINFHGWIKEEIEKHRCGIFSDPFHPTDLVKKILPFIENRKELEQYQSNSRALAISAYSRKILGERFVNIF